MEPSSNLRFLATWLLGYVRYTCCVLGYLATCLPAAQAIDQHEDNETVVGVNDELGVVNVNDNNVADSEHSLESKHKVFLSHSGAQKDFVEQLCVDLERCDRYPFFDKLRSSLPIGERFPKLIFDAIEQCWVGVVVFSEDFFMRSKWPMLELYAMVKEYERPDSSIRIVPVFYFISIEALKDSKNRSRWTSQWKEWACEDKEQRINVEEWMKALKLLLSVTSIVVKEGFGDVKIREVIVEEICALVPPETKWDDSNVQGRLRICEVIWKKMDSVQTSSEISTVGLYGMGGIGKTTICNTLCNNLSSKFHDNVCHVELGSKSEMDLLLKALKKLTTIRHDILDKLDNIGQGFSYLRKKTLNQAIFLALDNVQDNHKSIEGAQQYLKGGYGPGSVLLVTSRSLDVLKKLGLDVNNCLEMPEMEEDEARSLFLNYADLPCKHQVDEVLIIDCIKRCHFLKGDGINRHYHPLALKVLGQQLGCNSSRWAEQLRKIDTFNQLGDMEHPVFSILRNSFDSLKHEHQLIFMDVALFVPSNDDFTDKWARLDWLCMTHEESIEDMKVMLEVLKRKSLVEDLDGGFSYIGMHDLWREFAVLETKAKESSDPRWVYQVEEKRAILGRRGWENVERMCFLNWGWRGLQGLKLDKFENVTAFTLEVKIVVADAALELDLSALKHLKSLVMFSHGLTVRAEGLTSLRHLGFLLWHTPGFSPCLDGIGRLTNLQCLMLSDCKGIEVLDLTDLKLLRTVLIVEFADLVTLRGVNSRLANLRLLCISKCVSFRDCPGLGESYALEILFFHKCDQLEELPYLGRLTNLRALHLQECASIRGVPGLSDLVALEDFHAQECSKLSILPDLVNPTNLRELDVKDCPMQGVPGFDNLFALTKLRASFRNLCGEQPNFSKLSALKQVEIHGWNGPIWSSIQNLPMLEILKLYDSKGEDVDVPDLQNLKRLKYVLFQNCNFKDLSGLSNSMALDSLFIYMCDHLERLPEFESLTKLRLLGITGCNNLRDWPSASKMCSLEFLAVDSLSLMKIVPDLEILSGLRELQLADQGCENVLSVIRSLFCLETLKIFNFSTMEALDVSNLLQLKKLELDGWSALKRVTCRISLPALNTLKVRYCKSLLELPDFSKFPQLEKLSVRNCSALWRVACSRPSTAMKEIKLIGCNRQIEIPDLSRFPKFEVLRVEDHVSRYDGEGNLKVDDMAEKVNFARSYTTLLRPVNRRFVHSCSLPT